MLNSAQRRERCGRSMTQTWDIPLKDEESRLSVGRGVAAVEDLVGVQASVDSVRDDGLARLEGEFLVVEEDVDLVRLEGDEVGDAGDLGPGLRVGPGCAMAAADVVVNGQALVGAERLSLGRGQRVLVDVLAWHVPAGRESGFVERDRAGGVG